ncbi:MAG: PEP-CTERM sorting domain-containing protein, partial [Pirellulales bacterium]
DNNATQVSSSETLHLFNTEYEYNNLTFRLASSVAVPEPSNWAMALMGGACGGWGMWRRRRAALPADGRPGACRWSS